MLPLPLHPHTTVDCSPRALSHRHVHGRHPSSVLVRTSLGPCLGSAGCCLFSLQAESESAAVSYALGDFVNTAAAHTAEYFSGCFRLPCTQACQLLALPQQAKFMWLTCFPVCYRLHAAHTVTPPPPQLAPVQVGTPALASSTPLPVSPLEGVRLSLLATVRSSAAKLCPHVAALQVSPRTTHHCLGTAVGATDERHVMATAD